jgi:hypothetical protein
MILGKIKSGHYNIFFLGLLRNFCMCSRKTLAHKKGDMKSPLMILAFVF